jgi:hypothetical protein
MLRRILSFKVLALCCALLLTLSGVNNAKAQSRQKTDTQSSRGAAQPIDWGRALDLSPQNTDTKRERLGLQKELELGGQIRAQNERARADLLGRQDSRSGGTSRGAAVSSPQIEIRGVFEGNRSDRSNDSDRQSNRSQTTQGGYVPQARPDLVGSPYYYNARRIDLYWNNPGVRDPYYGKAAKYYDRYVNQVAPTLTPAGQGFVTRVGSALERMIDDAIRRDPVGFARLERDPVAFGRFMADTHTRAYYESGFANLPASDKWKIARAIDIRDLVDRDGRRTARDLIPGAFGSTPPQYARPAPQQYNPCPCRSWRR